MALWATASHDSISSDNAIFCQAQSMLLSLYLPGCILLVSGIEPSQLQCMTLLPHAVLVDHKTIPAASAKPQHALRMHMEAETKVMGVPDTRCAVENEL